MAKTPPLLAAEVVGNAVGKAGQAIKKPVFGSKITYEWDGEEWVPLTKETTREVPAWMAGLGVVVTALGLATLAGTVASTGKRLAKREE